jgi:hypothetical protein
MKKILKSTWPFLLGWVVTIAVFFGGKQAGYEQGYSSGRLNGFSEGLDTAAAIDDHSFDSLMTKMREDYRKVEDILVELQARRIEEFKNHSQIKKRKR